jgi:hypothetical protein
VPLARATEGYYRKSVHLLVLACLLVAPAALGQDEEPPEQAARPTKDRTVRSTRLKVQVHWPAASFELSAIVTGRRNVFVGVDLVAGFPLGRPTRTARKSRVASGWMLMPLLEASLGGVNGPVCEGARLCGNRFIAGPGLKFGHGIGVEREEGVVRPLRMLYIQGAVLGGLVDILPGPLSPGAAWWEGLIRVRVGAHLGTLDRSDEPSLLSTFSLNVAATVEYVAISEFTRGFGFGGVVGLAF